MSSTARPMISTALALVAGASAGADFVVARLPAAAQPFNGGAELIDSDFGSDVVRMRLLRSNGQIAIAIDLAGNVNQVKQKVLASSWNAAISTSQNQRTIQGQSRLVVPELGNAVVSLNRSSGGLILSVIRKDGRGMNQAVVSKTATGVLFAFTPQPVPGSQTAFLDPMQPRRLPQQAFVPRLQRRAIAPAVGDIAVGTTAIANPNLLNITGPVVSVKYRQMNARHAFEDLVSRGGYGFVWVPVDPRFNATPASSAVGSTQLTSSGFDPMNPMGPGGQGQVQPTAMPMTPAGAASANNADSTRFVNMTMRNQPFSRVFNALLMATQMQAKLEDGLVYVGPKVRETIIKSRFARTYRLNQVTASSAADYLANLGATVTKTLTRSTAITQGSSNAEAISGAPNAATTTRDTSTYVQPYGSKTGPLLGLLATTDERLQSVTLVGDDQLIRTAEQFLKKIDLRQRQVALSIKILDITLDNAKTTENSFAFRGPGNSFIVSDRGELIGAFGNYLPPNDATFETMAGGASSAKSEYVDLEEGQSVVELDALDPAPVNPGENAGYIYKTLYDLVRSKIESSSTKVVVSPTLILSEDPKAIGSGSAESSTDQTSGTIGRTNANEAFIVSGIEEITSYNVQAGQNGAANTCQPEFSNAGLRLGAKVTKIDDNGFVSFVISPEISAVVGTGENVPGCGPIKTMIRRKLDTGNLRVRAGQTLILTGVISDYDQQVVQKWPVLGDIPIVGQFFRSSTLSRQKRELVIMVTPQIIDDDQGGVYGYGYTPSRVAAPYLPN